MMLKSFLINEGYEIIEINPRKTYDVDVNIGGKFGSAELSFYFNSVVHLLKSWYFFNRLSKNT